MEALKITFTGKSEDVKIGYELYNKIFIVGFTLNTYPSIEFGDANGSGKSEPIVKNKKYNCISPCIFFKCDKECTIEYYFKRD